MINNRNFTKQDISNYLSQLNGFPKALSKKIINEIIEIMIDCVKANKLIIKNIGAFKIVYKKERVGRNPRTKIEYKIKARKSISFILSKSLETKINTISV